LKFVEFLAVTEEEGKMDQLFLPILFYYEWPSLVCNELNQIAGVDVPGA